MLGCGRVYGVSVESVRKSVEKCVGVWKNVRKGIGECVGVWREMWGSVLRCAEV